MAILHPFRALRPVADRVSEIASVPYDVINTEEARRLAEGKPLSFLHVIRPEIDFTAPKDEHDDDVYTRGAENLCNAASSDKWLTEAAPSLYLYRLVMGQREQTGIFGCVSVADYDNDVILKHEKTRPAKEDDRMRHIMTQRAHAEPVMLAFRSNDRIAGLMTEARHEAPLYDFEAEDGIRHTIWRIPAPEDLVEAFAELDRMYVADGHHRCKAASRVAEVLRKEGNPEGEFNFFPAVLFPMSEMFIMPYNRIIRKLPVTADQLLDRLGEHIELVRNSGAPNPSVKGEIALYLEGRWHTARLPETQRTGVADRLDVSLLSEHVLEPVLSISDPRTDANIDFVGGIRGTAELEQLVNSGAAELAISMFPTSIEELVAVSDAGLLMPPKSTWFEPKLRSGLLVHTYWD